MKHFTRKTLSMIALLTLAAPLSAGGKYVRVAWDTDPAHNAVVGFTPESRSGSAYIMYGTATEESAWKQADAGELFDHDGFKSRFVHLKNLKEDAPIYFKVCDDSGCDAARYWFRTAPTESKPFTFIAGGDTRSGWTTRRKGNALIAKIRPLFVMHGGDYTSRNTGRDWTQYFKDWGYTYSSDSIGGTDYKRVYPIVTAHGNHEDGDYSTLCNVFGVDYNQDGQCDEYDTYGAMNVTPLLRVYSLNTEFQYSSWSRQAKAMNQWLKSDLASEGSSAQWRVAEYHKPMFPHYSGKRENPAIYQWWAQLFYDKGVNLVVESDSHVFKVTDVLKPQSRDFTASRAGGTMYVGEGTWGAPPRDSDDAKEWTLDTESIQQFKVVRVYSDKLEVRTAQFGGNPSTLSRNDRNQNRTKLPDGVEWWETTGYGKAIVLRQNASGQSTLGKEDNTEETTDEPKPDPEVTPEPAPAPKPDVKPEPKPTPKPTPKPDVKPEPAPAPKPVPDVRPAPRPNVTPTSDVKPTPKPDVAPEPEAKPDVKPEPKSDMDTEEIDENEVFFDVLGFGFDWDIDQWFHDWFDDIDFGFNLLRK